MDSGAVKGLGNGDGEARGCVQEVAEAETKMGMWYTIY